MTPDRIIALVGVGLAISGLIAAYVFYRRGRKIKALASQIQINKVFETDKHLKNLNITIDAKKVERLDLVKVRLWNAGNETILKEHISTVDKLTITLPPGTEIFDFTVEKQTHKRVNASFKVSDYGVEFEFSQMEPKDGFVLRLLIATRKPITKSDIVLSGSVHGIHEVGQLPKTFYSRIDKAVDVAGPIIFSAAFPLIMILGFLWFIIDGIMALVFKNPDSIERFSRVNDTASGVELLIAVSLMAGFIVLMRILFIAHKEKSPPKDLE